MGVEALRSFTSNAAGPSQHLQLPFSFDLVFSNAPLRARRVAASRRRQNSTTRVISSHSSAFGNNRGLDHSCICRANSGLPENQPDGGIKNQPEQGNESNTKTVRVRFGSSHLDGFRRSSSLDFEDEFFTRMVALEASHRDTGRATFFENGATTTTPPTEPSSSSHEPLCALGMGGVQLPSSIKKLRRQNRSSSAEQQQHPQGCAIRNAFSSMVYMIKAVQSHALQIRQVLFSEWDVQEVLHLVHREMHSSFVWLFQQVFACTPKLMVSVMLLLANFTVYSMGENVAFETPAPIAFFLSTYGNPQASLDPHFMAPRDFSSSSSSSPRPSSGGSNNNKPPPPGSIAESFEGDGRRALNVFSHRDSIRDAPPLLHQEEENDATKLEMMKAWVESSMMELKSKLVHHHPVQLEQETIRRLVAPVVAHLESDNYACFDRTDLEYQHALSKDPSNPLLHANYAQFLYVVRHDHDRAESYFHRAMQADPLDSTILGRFASFLWLGRGNRAAAERAYKAAMAADPDSSFPASNYAHFLWHVGDGGESSHGPMTV